MSDHLRTQAGAWCGGLTDTSVVIRASILRSVANARVIVAEDEQLSTNATSHDAVSVWVDPDRSYRHQIATFAPVRLQPSTNYCFRLQLDGDVTKALPGRFRIAPQEGQPSGFRFGLGGCAKPKLFDGTRPEAYKAVADLSDQLFFFHLGDFHYENIGEPSVVPRLEAYDDTLRREGIGDLFRRLPLAYCWDDHDFLGNDTAGGAPITKRRAGSPGTPTIFTCPTTRLRRRRKVSTNRSASGACCFC
jgi:phosphodiesterase/alkaline phosphatase D-like protein